MTDAPATQNPARALLKRQLHRLYGALRPFTPHQLEDWSVDELRAAVLRRLEGVVRDNAESLNGDEAQLVEVVREVHRELTRLGPLHSLLKEDGISEVMINARDTIFVEKGGRLMRVKNLAFDSDEHVIAVARQILAPLGKNVDDGNPMCDARTADGSRVNVVIPPLAPKGPTLTIRRFSKTAFQGMDLVRFGSMSPNMLKFLELCVRERISMVVAGGTGSGKTTLLNVLSSFIPNAERIVTIEDAAELQLNQEHVVTLEARTTGVDEGKQVVHIRDLVRNSLRMRPDRVVVGECRGGEALDMLQAMNTGHEGSMTTVHANSPRDVLARLETLVMMAGYDLPLSAIRSQIASAVGLIIQQSRFRDGSRKVTSISEITGIQNDTILMAELFTFKHEGYDREGRAVGRFACSGFVPKIAQDMRTNGVQIDLDMFAQADVDRT